MVSFFGKYSNLQMSFWTFLRELSPFLDILTFKNVDLQNVGQVLFRKNAVRWQMSKSTKDSHTFFAIALAVSEILYF